MQPRFHHQTKREQFAKKVREQQRNLIINQRRNHHWQQSTHPQQQKHYLYSQLCEFNFKQDILSFHSLGYQSFTQQQSFSQQTNNKINASRNQHQWSISSNSYPSKVADILSYMVKYISQLQHNISRYESFHRNSSQTQNTYAFIENVINNLLLLSLDCIYCSLFLKQSTACLSQLAAIKHTNIYLSYTNQYFAYLMHCLCSSITPIIKQASNLQLTINCIYIMGNLHKEINNYQIEHSLVVEGQRMYEIAIIDTLLKLCSQYPLYENCLLLMVWYLRNCLLVDMAYYDDAVMKHKDAMIMESEVCFERASSIQALFVKTVNIGKQLIVSATAYIPQYFPKQTPKGECISKTQQYLLQTIQDTLSMLSLLLNCMTMLFSDVNKYQKMPQERVPNMLWSIDQALNILISDSIYPTIVNSSAICDNLIEICENVMNLTFSKNGLQIAKRIGILPCVINSAQMIVGSRTNLDKPEMRGSRRYSLITDIIQHQTYVSVKVRNKIIVSIITHIDVALKSIEAVQDRQLRVSIFAMIDQLLDTVSSRDIRKYMQETQYFHTNADNSCTSPPVIEQLTLYCLQTKIVQPLLHVLVLMLVDCEHDNVVLGLKTILKLIDNWELEKQSLGKVVGECGLDGKIIELQDDRNEEIYNLAITVIDELDII